MRLSPLFLVGLLTTAPLQAQVPEGWVRWGPDTLHHRISLDTTIAAHGRASLTILAVTDVTPNDWSGARQFLDARLYHGHRIHIQAMVRTREATQANLYGKIEGFAGDTAVRWFYDDMANRPRQGTSDWSVATVVLDVPREATRIVYGALLQGSGQLWVDNFTITVVDAAEETTTLEMGFFFPEAEWATTKAAWSKDVLNVQPRNLDFESSAPATR